MHRILIWETSDFTCQIVGETPEIPPFIVLPTAFIQIQVGRLVVDGHPELPPTGSPSGPPLFVEDHTYRMSIRWKTAKRQIVASGDRLLEPVPFDDADRSEFQFNFGSSVGFGFLMVDRPPYVLRFEVLPRKIDYREDYRLIKHEIANQAHALAFNAVGRTSELVAADNTAVPLEAETYAIAQSVLSHLGALLDRLEDQPHKTIVREERSVRLEGRNRISSDDWRRIVRKGPVDRRRVYMLRMQEPSLETYENRFIKWALTRTVSRLGALKAQVTAPDERRVDSLDLFRNRLETTRRAIEFRLKRGFLADVTPHPSHGLPLSLVFQLHPIYRQVYADCLLLLAGLELEGHVLQMGMKDLATLYEYWCFLTIVRLLQRHAAIESQSLVRIQRRRANLTLVKGRESTVSFRRRTDGAPISVSYNAPVRPIWTTPQQPDAVININSGEAQLILDAKYRVQFDPQYVQSYGSPGPTEDDINRMHRYRDAVVFVSGGHRARAKEASALFPIPSSVPFVGTRLHQSLDTVGVGGLPCAPGNLSALEQYLVTRLSLEPVADPSKGAAQPPDLLPSQ